MEASSALVLPLIGVESRSLACSSARGGASNLFAPNVAACLFSAPDLHSHGKIDQMFEVENGISVDVSIPHPVYPTPPPASPHLPLSLFNAPSQSSQQHVGLDLSLLEQRGQLNTPTMHPNLVSTLKSIISCSSVDGEDGKLVHQKQQAESKIISREMHATEASCSAPGLPHVSIVNDSSAMFSEPSPSPITVVRKKSKKKEADERLAAIVPVDLIRNKRPFKCGYGSCTKTFKNPQTLRMHRKTHRSSATTLGSQEEAGPSSQRAGSGKAGYNKKIPSRCPICKRSFVGLYELRRHFGRKHSEGEKAHACSKCDKRFYIEVDLRDHEKLCGEPLQCRCGIKFAFKCNLVAHKKTHPSCQDPSPISPPTAPLLLPLAASNLAQLLLQQQQQNHATAMLASCTSGGSTASTVMMMAPSSIGHGHPAALSLQAVAPSLALNSENLYQP